MFEYVWNMLESVNYIQCVYDNGCLYLYIYIYMAVTIKPLYRGLLASAKYSKSEQK